MKTKAWNIFAQTEDYQLTIHSYAESHFRGNFCLLFASWLVRLWMFASMQQRHSNKVTEQLPDIQSVSRSFHDEMLQ